VPLVLFVGDDVSGSQTWPERHFQTDSPFPRAVQATDDEVVVFSWIVYGSREHRDAVNAKVFADPRLKGQMTDMPFDGKRIIYSGFEPFLQL
jgi:uncharacterized protein YbaA (DUF1428 family)